MKITFDLLDSHIPLKTGHLHMGQKNRTGHAIEVANRYLLKNGEPWLPVMGEFHYSRYDRSEWETELLKMKAGGIQIISSYLIWIHHEETEGIFNFEGDRDVRYFVELCKKHGLYFLARLGPWVHGEVRNGGFPDWILNYKVRTNDEAYLAVVKRLYEAYYAQLKDLLFLDNGPVIGIQLENELVDNAEHLLKLKELAVEAGFDVPLYTVTAWCVSGVGQFPKGEVLPVFGSYPEAPWRPNIDTFERKPHYFFAPGRNDITIGSDLIKGFSASQTEAILDDYPFAYCELGPGVQATHHRRPVIRPYDLYTILIITLAKGNNLPGYYVFHGGRNPKGPLKLYQESKVTGYPNDLPVISYDFQAPIGEYGFVKASYDYYRLLHTFLNQYGSHLAVCETHYPDIAPKCRKDCSTPRCAVRVDEKGSGYLYFNTNQRNEQLEAAKQIQIELSGSSGKQTIPMRPLDIPAGTSCFFPLNRHLESSVIKYALAQPVTEMYYHHERYCIYAAVDGIQPEMVIEGEPELLTAKGKVDKQNGNVWITEIPTGYDPAVSFCSNGVKTHIIVLTFMDALRLYQTEIDGQSCLFLSDAHIYFDEGQVVLYGEARQGEYEIKTFPEVFFAECKNREKDGCFTSYKVAVNQCKAQITLTETATEIPEDNPYIPYLFAENLKDTKEYLMHVTVLEQGDMEDIEVSLDGEFDVMQIYEGEELTGDSFHLGGLTKIGIKRYGETLGQGKPIRFKLSPYSMNKQVLLEQRIEREQVALSLYQWTPQYKKCLNMKTGK